LGPIYCKYSKTYTTLCQDKFCVKSSIRYGTGEVCGTMLTKSLEINNGICAIYVSFRDFFILLVNIMLLAY
jgi:hypothetical protein